MLDRNQEGVLCWIAFRVASAVMLDLDDESLKLANVGVEKERPEERVVFAVFSLVADEDSQDATGIDGLKQPLHRPVQLALELFKALAVAQVIRVIGIPDNVPVGGVVPDQIKLFFGQRAGKDIPALSQVSAFVVDTFHVELVYASHHIPDSAASLSRVENTPTTEPQDKVLDEIP